MGSMWSVRSSSFCFVSSNVERALWVSEKRAFIGRVCDGRRATPRTRHGTTSHGHTSRGLGGHGGRRVERPAGSGPQTTKTGCRHVGVAYTPPISRGRKRSQHRITKVLHANAHRCIGSFSRLILSRAQITMLVAARRSLSLAAARTRAASTYNTEKTTFLLNWCTPPPTLFTTPPLLSRRRRRRRLPPS